MQLSELAAEPQLKKLVLDDEDVIEKYGEPIEFYIHDRLPLDEYMNLVAAMTNESGEYSELLAFARGLMLDENGKPVLSDGKQLPTKIAMTAMNKISAELGNL
jgi:hypothetical protein